MRRTNAGTSTTSGVNWRSKALEAEERSMEARAALRVEARGQIADSALERLAQEARPRRRWRVRGRVRRRKGAIRARARWRNARKSGKNTRRRWNIESFWRATRAQSGIVRNWREGGIRSTNASEEREIGSGGGRTNETIKCSDFSSIHGGFAHGR